MMINIHIDILILIKSIVIKVINMMMCIIHHGIHHALIHYYEGED